MSLDGERRQYLAAYREEAQRRLLTWYHRHARNLPWRHDRTPYRVWVSEVMLQQTQVDTVVDYYRRFLERFPTIDALSEASQEDVLKLWEGLGYYSRARSLHRAAQQVARDYDGQLPGDVAALKSLPGIGPYTAGAIASIAFGIPAPAVDGNVRRVMARVLAEPDPRDSDLEAAVQLWMPEDAPGAFTEALMELGATLCTPRSPQCLLCPWRDLCRACDLGEQESYPAPKVRKALPHYDVVAAVTLRQNADGEAEALVARRLQDAMLGGLWEFPGGKRHEGESLPEALYREMWEEMGITVKIDETLTVVKHAYTHFRITLHAFICRLTDGEPQCFECQDFRWATMADIQTLPMAVTDRKIAAELEAWLSDQELSEGKSG
ncbi:MAG: A/G-specific adenine glycosylase [Anaerolineae bacterium]|nr:A/G-specific adenine glycosylase [Anaerolineae bacterium]